MPLRVRKVKNKDCYRVTNVETGELLSECTTRAKALAQVKLLEEIDNKKKVVKEKVEQKVEQKVKPKKKLRK